MQRDSPESLKAVPEELKELLKRGHPGVLGELLKSNPELFRNPALAPLEDEAFEQVLK